ncbi:hypothetical protein BD410DRAFT_726638, partial [Rickenella mellea]
TAKGKYELNLFEVWWRNRSSMFAQRGYMLQPRYQPGWELSWMDTNIHPIYCEDSCKIMHWKILDAKRLFDGKTVIIKRVPLDSSEGHIAQSI